MTADIFTPTVTGCDVRRGCGCVERLDPDWDAWFVVSLCPEHVASSASIDHRIPMVLDHELDATVIEANHGHRIDRIRPRDTSKEK